MSGVGRPKPVTSQGPRGILTIYQLSCGLPSISLNCPYNTKDLKFDIDSPYNTESLKFDIESLQVPTIVRQEAKDIDVLKAHTLEKVQIASETRNWLKVKSAHNYPSLLFAATQASFGHLDGLTRPR